jgi:hypothetical protein
MQRPQQTDAGRAAERGVTLLELTAALTLAVIILLTLQSTMLSSIRGRERTRVLEARVGHAHEYLQRLLVLPFGTTLDPAATDTQLTELFDDDMDLGNVSLMQVRTAPGAPGHSFTTVRDDVATDWRVVVGQDLDRDGALGGFREGRNDLLLIEVFAENRLMFRTLRAADFANTTRDG